MPLRSVAVKHGSSQASGEDQGDPMIRGRCLCEAVRYEVGGPLYKARNCHCSICRRLSGAAFGTYAQVNSSDFRWLCGAGHVKGYKTSPAVTRCFCDRCGSTLGVEIQGSMSYVTLGTVEGDPGIRPEANVFVGSKASWHEIQDRLPEFKEWPPWNG